VSPKKRKDVAAAAQAPASKRATEKRKHAKGSSHSGDQTFEQEKLLTKSLKQSKNFKLQSSGLSVTEKASSAKVMISAVKTSSASAGEGGAGRASPRALDLFDSSASD
jgi:hypothetical protein